MQPGNQKDISVVFPDDYEVELWQGLQGKAHVTIYELFTWVLPQVRVKKSSKADRAYFCRSHRKSHNDQPCVRNLLDPAQSAHRHT